MSRIAANDSRTSYQERISHQIQASTAKPDDTDSDWLTDTKWVPGIGNPESPRPRGPGPRFGPDEALQAENTANQWPMVLELITAM